MQRLMIAALAAVLLLAGLASTSTRVSAQSPTPTAPPLAACPTAVTMTAAPAAAGSSGYNHGDVGLTASYKGFALDLRYTGTDLTRLGCGNFYMTTRNACAGGAAATLTYNFALLP